MDVPYFQQNLEKLAVEKLEIAEEARIEIENEKIRLSLRNSVFNDIYEEQQKHSNMVRMLGTPISSAIACALAKASGKLVNITADQSTDSGKTISIEYSLLDIPEEG